MSTTRPGYFGAFGGRFVAETLIPALDELEAAVYSIARSDPFQRELAELLRTYVGRPTPVTHSKRYREALVSRGVPLTELLWKREDLCHTGSHKLNNALGQVLLAKKMGKTRVIAETGAGQHGVATATAAALLNLECEIFQGELDVERQAPNVLRMRMLGARVVPVKSGSRTLKDAMNEAMRAWVTHIRTTYYCVGSVAGPHPYPSLVAELQRVIGDEAKSQLERPPDAVVACVGGGSNAMGIFRAFLTDPDVALFGVEAAGDGVDTPRHAATLTRGRVGVLHGSKSYVLCDSDGQIQEAHSISAGLDYPGVGPEHAHLHETGRVRYLAVTDDEAARAAMELARTEGILVALETAHAVAAIERVARSLAESRGKPGSLLVNLSGRGDKDLATYARLMGNGNSDADAR